MIFRFGDLDLSKGTSEKRTRTCQHAHSPLYLNTLSVPDLHFSVKSFLHFKSLSTHLRTPLVLVGCIGASTPSTGYEPKARSNGSTNGSFSARWEILAQASIEHSLGNSAMSDVPTTENLCLERSDANTLIFEQGGKESVLLNIEVKEINRANRITCRMAQDEVCSARLAMFHQHKQSQLALR